MGVKRENEKYNLIEKMERKWERMIKHTEDCVNISHLNFYLHFINKN